MRNTSDALSSVANGVSWRPGDNIVTFRKEFPSNIYPWLRIRDAQQVEVRMCEERLGRIDLSEMSGLVDGRTRIIAISHIQFASGFRANLELLGRLARKHDALLVVDTIQSLGVTDMCEEAAWIDVAAGACHKWLLTPEGIGYLYLSDRARERIAPTLVGWVSVPNPEDYFNREQGWKEDALAWETGTAPSSLFYGLEASLKLITEVGARRIADYLEQLTDYLCARLDRRKYCIISSRVRGEKSQIVSIKHTGFRTPMNLYADLRTRNIITAPRGDGLRISPHFNNTKEDIDQLLYALP
jgi:selenocysteine lyase/cysteine desulfurase